MVEWSEWTMVAKKVYGKVEQLEKLMAALKV
jgi:hypothetical protein